MNNSKKPFPFHDGGGSAGLEGTPEVVKNYLKGVPFSRIEINQQQDRLAQHTCVKAPYSEWANSPYIPR